MCHYKIRQCMLCNWYTNDVSLLFSVKNVPQSSPSTARDILGRQPDSQKYPSAFDFGFRLTPVTSRSP